MEAAAAAAAAATTAAATAAATAAGVTSAAAHTSLQDNGTFNHGARGRYSPIIRIRNNRNLGRRFDYP